MMNTAVMIPRSTGTARSRRRVTYRVIDVNAESPSPSAPGEGLGRGLVYAVLTPAK
jgi:hypothetical protein